MKKIKVLMDTNILLTYVSGREDNYTEAIEDIIESCVEEESEGYVAFHSLSIIWYVSRKHPEEERRQWLQEICELLTVVSADQKEVLDAISNKDFKDFEDCLQDKCAKMPGCDYIITANTKDYIQSEIPAVTPTKFLEIMRKS